MDLSKFIGEDEKILKKFEKNEETKQDSYVLTFEDYLNLPTTELYEINEERKNRMKEEADKGWQVWNKEFNNNLKSKSK